MASVCKVILVGNLGKDPETRFMPNGDQVTNATIATSETWKDKNSGEQKETTEWHRVVFFRKLAEIAGQYLKKGSQVYIEGKLKTRKWQDKDGQDRYTTEILVDELKMLGKREGGSAEQGQSNGGNQPRQQPTPSQNQGNAPGYNAGGVPPNHDDDIPFAKIGGGLSYLCI